MTESEKYRYARNNVRVLIAAFEILIQVSENNKPNGYGMIGVFMYGTRPYLQYVTFKNDHGFKLSFELDLLDKKVSLHSCDLVYLSKADQATEKYRYLVMKSIVDVHTDMGGKKFRKTTYKNMDELYSKMNDYAQKIFADVDTYTRQENINHLS